MSNASFDMSGRAALVTGAASGLGFAMAQSMAENGAAVCLADVDAAGLESAGDKLAQVSNMIDTQVVDVRDPQLSSRLFRGLHRLRAGSMRYSQTPA